MSQRGFPIASLSSEGDYSPRKRMQRSDTVDFMREIHEYSHRFREPFLRRVVLVFCIFLYVIIERIFSEYIQNVEIKWISSLQRELGIKSHSEVQTPWYGTLMEQFATLETGYLVLTHFYFTMYYAVDAILCIKVFYVHTTVLFFINVMELLYKDPRPYWVSADVKATSCARGFGHPSSYLFNVLFLIFYTRFCWRKRQQAEHQDKKGQICFFGTTTILGIILAVLQVLGGQYFINTLISTFFYFLLTYYVCTFSNPYIDTLVLKSTLQVEDSKKYVFYWLLVIIFLQVFITIIYASMNPYINIEWMENYMKCLGSSATHSNAKATFLIGPWMSYLKSTFIFATLGGIFGAAKTFREMKNEYWFKSDGSLKIKIIRGILANIILVIPWILFEFNEKILEVLYHSPVNEAYLFAAEFFLLYFIGFGLLPKYLFAKLRLVNTSNNYVLMGDEPYYHDTMSILIQKND